MAGFAFSNPTQYATAGGQATPITPQLAQQLALAAQLQQGGSSSAPIYGGYAEGLARLAQGLLGGYLSGQAGQEAQANQSSIADTLAKAAAAGKGWTSPDTFQGNNGQTIQAGSIAPGTGGRLAMAAALAGNPLTAGMGADVGLEAQKAEEDKATQAARDTRLFGQQTALQAQSEKSSERLAAAAQGAARQLEGMRENAPTEFEREMRFLGLDPQDPASRAMFLARHGVKNPGAFGAGGAPAEKPGFAGGTPTPQLYDGSDADKAMARADATAGAKAITDVNASADRAISQKPVIANLQGAADQVYTGPLAGVNNFANRMASVFSPEAAQKVQNFETLESGAADMARHERQPGEGVISDFDAKQFMKIVPNPGRSRAFNDQALSMRQAANNTAPDKQAFMAEFRRRNGNLVNADAAWNDYASANPIFSSDYDIEKPGTWANPTRKTWQQYFGIAAPSPSGAAPAPTAQPALIYDPKSGQWVQPGAP